MRDQREELTVIASGQECWFLGRDVSGVKDVCASIEEALVKGACPHVGATDLMPSDGRFLAVLDESCVDPMTGKRRCKKTASGVLHLFATRVASAATISIKVQVSVESWPAQVLQIVGGVEKSGVSQKTLQPFVLHPYYAKAPQPNWQSRLPLSKAVPSERTAAAVEVRLGVRRENIKSNSQLISIPVLVEAQSEREDLGVPMNLDLTTIVVTESLKLLVKDGWDFFKNHAGGLVPGSSELIQLNIGGTAISQAGMIEETVGSAINSSQLHVPNEVVNELGGLNRRLEALGIKRRNLTSLIERASTSVEKANTQTELELVELDIVGVKERIWAALRDSGGIKLQVSRGSIR